jgi:hypothetical protein
MGPKNSIMFIVRTQTMQPQIAPENYLKRFTKNYRGFVAFIAQNSPTLLISAYSYSQLVGIGGMGHNT